MKQAVLKQQGALVVADVQENLVPQADEVLVEMKVAIICGSGLSYFQAETPSYDLQYLPVLGHEMAGIARETNIAVSSVQKGDRVAAGLRSYCGHCEACQRGDYNFCESL